MADEVGAFLRREEVDRGRDEARQLGRRCVGGRAQERFQFCEREFDGIEVGTVRREKPQVRARVFDGELPRGCLCTVRLSSTTTSPGRSAGTSTCDDHRPVEDRTGLTGNFDIDLDWTPDRPLPAPPAGAPAVASGGL